MYLGNWLTLAFGFIVGTILGSFTKALADRSLKKVAFWGRSYCPGCKHKLQWYDLFPILSYLFLKGKCRYCNDKIGVEYLLVEVVMGILIGFLFWQSLSDPSTFHSIFNFKFINFIFELIYKIFFIIILAALFLTDIKKMLIPDRIILPSLLIGLILSLGITIYKLIYFYYSLSNHPLGKYLLPPYSNYFLRHAFYTAQPILSGIVMALLIGGFFFSLILITKGRGMGGGDVKLGAFIGLMLGFPQSLLALMLSFILGAFFSIFLIILGKKHFGQVIPFGPFLVLGSLISLFWGPKILDWYLRFSYSKFI